jgi:hypothetical protein
MAKKAISTKKLLRFGDIYYALPGNYIQCDAECTAPAPGPLPTQIQCNACKPCDAAGCRCRLFSIDLTTGEVRFEANEGVPITPKTGRIYRCWCVQHGPVTVARRKTAAAAKRRIAKKKTAKKKR